MVMSHSAVVELANDLLIPGHASERQNLDRVDKWWRWNPEEIILPEHANKEHRSLREVSETPWLSLVVTTLAQQLVAELVRSSEVEDTAAIWKPWQRNRMNSRQRGIHRAALGYGYSYATVLPGDSGAVIRGKSPRELYAVYADPVVDEYPMYYLEQSGGFTYVVDEEARYTLRSKDGKAEYVDHQIHGVGVAPAVRYSNQIDLEGRTPGEVEPFIGTAKRINKTDYDRMLVQHFNSWKIRTATNMEKPGDEAEGRRLKLLLRQSDILTGEGDVQFGTLDETPLDGFISAHDSDVEALAAVTQTPTHALTGNMINLGADAIVEARAMLDLKSGERKIGFGDSHCQTLRLSAHVENRPRDAQDFTLMMQWADLGSRSMAQAADALGKMATMLGVPVEMLWDRIPGVNSEDVRVWKKFKRDNPSADEQLAAGLYAQANGADG